MKRTILAICLLLCLCFSALAEAPAAPAVTPNPTPQPIPQYSIADLISAGIRMLGATDAEQTTYTLQAYAPFGSASLAVQPAQDDRLQFLLTADAGSQPLELVVEFAPDAAYVRWQGDAVGLRYEDLMAAFIEPVITALSGPDSSQEDIQALAPLWREVCSMFTDGAVHITVGDGSIHLSTSATQLFQTLIRCADRIAQEEALIQNLFERYIHPLIPESYAGLKDVTLINTLPRLLGEFYNFNYYNPSDLIVSLTANMDDDAEKITGSARLYAPMSEIITLTFALEAAGENSDDLALSAQILYATMEEVCMTIDVKGVIAQEYTTISFIPLGYEQHTVTLDIAYDDLFSLMLHSSVGMLQLSETRDARPPRPFGYALRVNMGSYSLDGEISTSHWGHYIENTAHLGVRYPEWRDGWYTQRYDYFTLNRDDSIVLRLGDSLFTAKPVLNKMGDGMKNTVALSFDPDIFFSDDTIDGQLITQCMREGSEIRLSQTLETSVDMTYGWTLEAAPCEQAAQPIADAIMLTADDLRAVPDVLSAMIEEGSAAP